MINYPELKRFDDGVDVILQDLRRRNEKGWRWEHVSMWDIQITKSSEWLCNETENQVAFLINFLENQKFYFNFR